MDYTRVELSPISWEGWYWGAMHHYGNSLRLGTPSFYGTTEDCLEHAEVIVFWSSDPESTNGVYAGFEGTERRCGPSNSAYEFVHIDPYLTHSAQFLGGKWLPIKPGTDSALAIAIMHEWMISDSYDKEYVASKTTGFDEWRAYVLGEEDGTPKTPEWQEAETGVPAKDVRSLAQLWASKKTYLAAGGLGAGFGGACRTETGAQWARSVVMMMAMQGWGKPGINFGNLQIGAPQDLNFYFPGYAEGGISGDLNNTASAANNYCRMPHIITINPVKQSVPRQRLAEAIVEGTAEGFCVGRLLDRGTIWPNTRIPGRAIRASTCCTATARHRSAHVQDRTGWSKRIVIRRSSLSSTSRSGWRTKPSSQTSFCRLVPRSNATISPNGPTAAATSSMHRASSITAS